MSMRYAGGIISATPPTVTTSYAKGMWILSEQAQYKQQGVWPVIPPPPIGQAYGGGFFAGQISMSGTIYNIVVAPKASGQVTGKTWGVYNVITGFTSVIDGPTNTAGEAALGSSYQAATFCNNLNAGSGLNSYTDWYLPAKNELEVLYYFLKPSTTANNTSTNPSNGSNANAVSPEPISTVYTSGSPAQTTASDFIGAGSEKFDTFEYWSSTELNGTQKWRQDFSDGLQYAMSPTNTYRVRAIRKVLVSNHPTVIGQAWGGGFYAGKISVSGDGVATHLLIVAPKSSESSSRTWGGYGVTTGFTSVIDGPANTTGEVALGSEYEAAIFCNNLNSGGGLNGYSDWYLPAKNELEVLYYNLKPTTIANHTSSGSNANAVLPEPISTNYTSVSPAQTSAGIGFRGGETNAFASDNYWSSTEYNSAEVRRQNFYNGTQQTYYKYGILYVRAVRRIPII